MRYAKHLVPVLAAFVAGAATAGVDVSWVEMMQNNIVPPTIEVAAKAYGYTAVTTNSLTWQLSRGAACAGCGTVGSRLDITRISTGEKWFADFKWLNEAVFEINVNKSRNLTGLEKINALGVCKSFLDQQMAAGKSKAWVLSQDHQLAGPKLFTAKHTLLTSDNSDPSESIDLLNPVVCKRSPVVTPGSLTQPPQPPIPPGPQNLQQVFGVQSAILSVSPEQATVVSQAQLTVDGSVKANGKGAVKYRISHNGGLGPVRTLNFAQAGTKNLSFPLTIRCPKEGQQEQPAGGGGIGGLAGAPSNVKNGYVRLVVVAPDSGVDKSNDAAYSVTCKETGSLELPLPDLKVMAVKWAPAATRQIADLEEIAGVIVRNVGAKGAAATNLKITAKVGRAQKSWSAPIPALAKGEQVEVVVELGPLGSVSPPLQVRLDVPPKVQESNESNNFYQVN